MTPEEAWNSGRQPNHQTHRGGIKPRQLLSKYIIDTVCDTGNRHCYITDRPVPAIELQKWSEHITGDVWKFGTHFVHHAGPTSETYIHKDAWPSFRKSMVATQELTSLPVVGYTPSQHGSTIVEWLRIKDGSNREFKKLILPYFHFNACHPQTLPLAYYMDMKSAYWRMIERAPSPIIIYNPHYPKSFGYKTLKSSEQNRWDKMLLYMKDQKPTRLAIVGNWVGGYDPDRRIFNHFRNGKMIYHKPHRPTDLSTLGYYIIRLVYEICQEEYLSSQGLHAHVDCVISTQPTPTYWSKIGIEYEIKYSGPLHLISSQVFKIGDHESKYYHEIFQPLPPKPGLISRTITVPTHTSLPHIIPPDSYIHTSVLPHWKKPVQLPGGIQ